MLQKRSAKKRKNEYTRMEQAENGGCKRMKVSDDVNIQSRMKNISQQRIQEYNYCQLEY